MMFSHVKRTRFTSTLIILFTALHISACSTEDRANAIAGNIELDGQTIYEPTNNSATIFGGIDSASVIEDNNLNNNLLNVNAKLNVTGSSNSITSFIESTVNGNYGNLTIDTDGNWSYTADNDQTVIQNLNNGSTLTDNLTVSSTNGATHTITITIIGADETGSPPVGSKRPALISGVDTGSVIEDVDPDNDNLLEVNARLNITDIDAGEAAFIANTINGNYGNLVIHTNGNWHYAADNNQTVIQNLATGETLTDNLTVSSIDGTTRTIKITILGANETTNSNSPAVISGVNTGNVTEDVDPNNNNLLEVGGRLNITDSNTGEAVFIVSTINGNYGNLIIDTTGNWSYAANNNQAVIQNLTASTTLTDNLTVSSIDGTTHTVTITIFGMNENIQTANVTLSWVAPATREDNSALSLSEIAGYKVYYSTTQGRYQSSSTINDGSATGYSFNNLASATYYFVVITIDANGRESQYSPEITITI